MNRLSHILLLPLLLFSGFFFVASCTTDDDYADNSPHIELLPYDTDYYSYYGRWILLSGQNAVHPDEYFLDASEGIDTFRMPQLPVAYCQYGRDSLGPNISFSSMPDELFMLFVGGDSLLSSSPYKVNVTEVGYSDEYWIYDVTAPDYVFSCSVNGEPRQVRVSFSADSKLVLSKTSNGSVLLWLKSISDGIHTLEFDSKGQNAPCLLLEPIDR